MTRELRRLVLRFTLWSLAVSVGAFVFFAMDLDFRAASALRALVTFLAWAGLTVSTFIGSTVLNLEWWVAGGMLLAAFVVAHRRNGVAG